MLTETEKRDQLKDLILEFAVSQDSLKEENKQIEYFNKLEDIYGCEENQQNQSKFRHYYSDIFSWLTQIDNGDVPGDINILAQNITLLKEKYIPQNIDISVNLNKLYDHINLDYARITYVKALNEKAVSKTELRNVATRVEEQVDSISQLKQEVDNAKNDLHAAQKESVAILGIFASIVLSFTGGISFSASVLQNISAVSIYRLLIVTLILGFVVINTISILLKLVGKISGKEKFGICVVPVNIFLVICMICVCTAWFFDLRRFRM